MGLISLFKFAYHFFSILIIFIILACIRYPYILNGDYFFSADIGMLASESQFLINGGPIVFYYDYGRTIGLTTGLIAAPFIWVLGNTSLAFNILPGILYFALYIWSTYHVAKILVPRSAKLVLVLMFMTSPYLTGITSCNWQHILTAFFGNIIFILFIKIKSFEENKVPNAFLLFFTMGLAIYTYTYSLIFILTIAILYALTHPKWGQFREKLSYEFLLNRFKNKTTAREVFCYFLDILIFAFLVAVAFAYIFGGFGLDIGGISIFQINKFHKAATQLVILAFVRILISSTDFKQIFNNAKNYFSVFNQSGHKKLVFAGGVGFLLGLSPRIASILIGETSRGGQGHDVDFSPVKLLVHLQDLFARSGPKIFGFDKIIQDFTFAPTNIFGIAQTILIVPLLAIFIVSIVSFVLENRVSLGNILFFRGMKFQAIHLILLLPFIVCFANIMVQNGSMPRYLFPLFGVFTLWIGIYVDKIKGTVKFFPFIVFAIWTGFYSLSNYQSFQERGLIKEGKLVTFKKHNIYDVIEFLRSKNIKTAYSDYYISSLGTYFSGGKISISEYNDHPVSKARKVRSMNSTNFAVVVPHTNVLVNYRKFLKDKEIGFSVATIADYEIFWGFSGAQSSINELRSLAS